MNNSALFSLGFRPFFLIATLFSAILMSLWVFYYASYLPLLAFDYYSSMIWHGHEMIFAYAMAVVAGFLLTAIRNWTKVQTLNGNKLMILVLIWIAGRVAPFVLTSPMLIAVIDLLFLPLLAMAIAVPLVKSGNKRNYFMIVMVTVMALLNLLVHLEMLGFVQNIAIIAIKTAFYIIIALIIVMAGRVFPMFSQNGVPVPYQVVKYPMIEKLVMPTYLAFMLSLLFVGLPILTAIFAVIAAVTHSIRLKGWYNKQIWQVPLVWVLHVGYIFLIVGFLLTAISQFKPAYYFLALHMFSVGVLGVITIGMMARVSIGHTGRNLRLPPKVLKPAFILMVLATLIRTVPLLFFPTLQQSVITLSGLLWALAFFLFFIGYAKILISPRIDA